MSLKAIATALGISVTTVSRALGGFSDVAPSTPGVLRPVFSVTRLTASALAENERVNMRCKALTLRHCCSCVAFAIRNCSFFTRR